MNPFSVITGVMLISVATYQPFLRETPNCVEVRGSVDAELGFPVELPPPVGISGSGALPGPVNLGPIEGTLASVITNPGDGAQARNTGRWFTTLSMPPATRSGPRTSPSASPRRPTPRSAKYAM